MSIYGVFSGLVGGNVVELRDGRSFKGSIGVRGIGIPTMVTVSEDYTHCEVLGYVKNMETAILLSKETYLPEFEDDYFSYKLPKDLKESADFLLGKSPERITTLDASPGKVTLYGKSSLGKGFYFAVYEGRMVYYMAYRSVHFKPVIHSFSQIGVWRDPEWAGILEEESLADYTFEELLYSKTSSVISDKNQTSFGQKFWIKQFYKAVDSGKYVYWVKTSNEDHGYVKEIFRIKDKAHFKSIVPKIWGSKLTDKKSRLLISKEPIKFDQ